MIENVLIKRAIQDLIASEGWTYVEAFINERIEGCKTRLLSCKLEDVMNYRSKLDAYNSILLNIKDILDDKDNEEEV